MCMGNCGGNKSNSYVPKSKTSTRTTTSQTKAMKGWNVGGNSRGGNFGSPKVRMSFGKR